MLPLTGKDDRYQTNLLKQQHKVEGFEQIFSAAPATIPSAAISRKQEHQHRSATKLLPLPDNKKLYTTLCF